MKQLSDNLTFSLQELFAVLMPGAVMCFFVSTLWGADLIFATQTLPAYLKEDWVNGIPLFGAAYFLGYVAFVWSSNLEGVYDWIKRRALHYRNGFAVKPKSRIVNFLFPHLLDTYIMIHVVKAFKESKIGIGFDGDRHQVINAYQFAFRWLMKERPEMFEEAERYMATAKFFRTMVWVWVFGSFCWLLKAPLDWKWYSCYFIILAIVSFFTFLNRWRKANHVAFKNLIILESLKNPPILIKT